MTLLKHYFLKSYCLDDFNEISSMIPQASCSNNVCKINHQRENARTEVGSNKEIKYVLGRKIRPPRITAIVKDLNDPSPDVKSSDNSVRTI